MGFNIVPQLVGIRDTVENRKDISLPLWNVIAPVIYSFIKESWFFALRKYKYFFDLTERGIAHISGLNDGVSSWLGCVAKLCTQVGSCNGLEQCDWETGPCR